ncbi:hypothetical protein F4823DRAFT_620816 [Ustulina deusta]|nr:hypothetical protein F4823DRAFT_620816 [Ustulina deusta]
MLRINHISRDSHCRTMPSNSISHNATCLYATMCQKIVYEYGCGYKYVYWTPENARDCPQALIDAHGNYQHCPPPPGAASHATHHVSTWCQNPSMTNQTFCRRRARTANGWQCHRCHTQTYGGLVSGAMADLEEAYELFLIALHLYTSPISSRITSGRQLLTSLLIFRNPQEAHQIAQTTIQLIPLLAPRASQNTDKQGGITGTCTLRDEMLVARPSRPHKSHESSRFHIILRFLQFL